MDMSLNAPKQNFGSRCVQVRDADWVCRTIVKRLPHTSISKFKPVFTHQLSRTFPDATQKGNEPKTLEAIYDILSDLSSNKLNLKVNEKVKHQYELLEEIKIRIDKFYQNRKACEDRSYGLLHEALKFMENYKQGNCLENAIVAELILKMNGVKNAAICFLSDRKTHKPIDHVVCLFNTDGSKNGGIITNKTIIIDPWVGKSDFAVNMESYYKNLFQDVFDITDSTKLKFDTVETINLHPIELEVFKKRYPMFVFKSNKRKFME